MIIDIILTILLIVTVIGLVHSVLFRQEFQMNEESLAHYLEEDFSHPVVKKEDG